MPQNGDHCHILAPAKWPPMHLRTWHALHRHSARSPVAALRAPRLLCGRRATTAPERPDRGLVQRAAARDRCHMPSDARPLPRQPWDAAGGAEGQKVVPGPSYRKPDGMGFAGQLSSSPSFIKLRSSLSFAHARMPVLASATRNCSIPSAPCLVAACDLVQCNLAEDRARERASGRR